MGQDRRSKSLKRLYRTPRGRGGWVCTVLPSQSPPCIDARASRAIDLPSTFCCQVDFVHLSDPTPHPCPLGPDRSSPAPAGTPLAGRDQAGPRRPEDGRFRLTDPDKQIVMPTVAEDVVLSLRKSGPSRGEIAEQVRDSLARFDLSPHADHRTRRLSGGQKQPLALAAVLIRRSAVVAADEPTILTCGTDGWSSSCCAGSTNN
jgi:hypothetical protein